MKPILFALFVALLMVGCGEKIADWDDLENRNGVFYFANEDSPFTGGFESSYKNGEKRTEGTFENGKLDGLQTTWYRSGQKAGESKFEEGRLFFEVCWKPNGEKCPETNLKNGNGTVTAYYEDGTQRIRHTYLDGKHNGHQTEWHENGHKKIEGNCTNSLKEKLWTHWYENGTKEKEGNWSKGKADGFWIGWHENGQKEKKMNFKAGKLISMEVWKPTGEKCPKTNVKNGNGVWVLYNEDGTEEDRFTYKDGEEVED